MSRIIPLFAATLLLCASGEAAETPASGRSVSVSTSHAATPDVRRAWLERAVADILDGRPGLCGNRTAR